MRPKTPDRHAQTLVADWLRAAHAGRAKAATKEKIAEGMAMTTRAFELCVQALRAEGKAVGSNARGYFWCCDEADFAATFSHIMPRFRAMRATVDGLTRAQRAHAGQGVMFESPKPAPEPTLADVGGRWEGF